MKFMMKTLAASAMLVMTLDGCSLMNERPNSPQMAPGTSSRPVLNAQEAAGFMPEQYFLYKGTLSAPVADPWHPEPIDLASVKADYVVGAGRAYQTVQQAVNAAIRSGRHTRQYIRIESGEYTGAVYVPADAGPLTLYGAGHKPGDVRLQLALDARVHPAEYAAIVNPGGQFREGDPAWQMFHLCASQPANKVIDTPCSAVVWSQADDFQLKNLSITNTLLDTVDEKTHQAVALRTDGDRTQLEGLRMISRQDTLLVNAGESVAAGNKLGAYPTDRIARALIRDSYIEGDVDFVFGRANAVFDHCEFHAVSSRHKASAIVFAPDTVPASSFGFLVINSRMTGDAGFHGTGHVKLGRSWDQGSSKTGYLPGRSPNGQLVIRNTFIDDSFDRAQPWDQAATSKRPHTGNAGPARKLDDPAYNRLWEYANYGPGAEIQHP